MSDQKTRFERFKALHDGGEAFVIPNPWDAGSARLLASLGSEALATTSAGYAFARGKRDFFAGLGRGEIWANAAKIVAARTGPPVSGDLEDGFSAAPEDCATTIRLACEAGLVGGSIEDATGDPDAPIHGITQAVERIEAAAEAARDLPFLLTARAGENYLSGRPDLDDTIARLQAFSAAGADVLSRAGPSRHRGDPNRVPRRGQAGERGHGPSREKLFRHGAFRGRGSPHQRGRLVRPSRARRIAAGGAGGENARHVLLRRGCGPRRGHASAHVAGRVRRAA